VKLMVRGSLAKGGCKELSRAMRLRKRMPVGDERTIHLMLVLVLGEVLFYFSSGGGSPSYVSFQVWWRS
jgi:hypothetical protein